MIKNSDKPKPKILKSETMPPLATNVPNMVDEANLSIGLLKKYMAHVLDCEGWDYLEKIGYNPSEQNFSEEEINLLHKLRDEIIDENRQA